MFKDPDILRFPRSAPSSAQLSEKVHSIDRARALPGWPLSSAPITHADTKIGLHAPRGQGKYTFVLTLQSCNVKFAAYTVCHSVELSRCKQSLNVYSVEINISWQHFSKLTVPRFLQKQLQSGLQQSTYTGVEWGRFAKKWYSTFNSIASRRKWHACLHDFNVKTFFCVCVCV